MWRPFFALVMAVVTTAWPPPAGFQATVLRVLDGGTIVVRTLDLEQIKVRLYGLDLPERGQPGGKEAAAALKPLQGRTVTVREMDIDRSSRMVALVEYEGKSVNLGLVEQGRAWYYGQYCQEQPICGKIEKAESEARKAKRGIWAEDNPTPPWAWRRGITHY